jgi:hypothetical protein
MVQRNPQASYYGARYYDPNAGRFLSEDPIRYSGGMDFYAYVGNNPTNRTDPDGMGDTPRGCAEALAELALAQTVAAARLAQYIAHGANDPGHAKALGQALRRLQKAIIDVNKNCKCEIIAAEVAAAVAAAGAVVEKILEAIQQFCSQDPEVCFAW